MPRLMLKRLQVDPNLTNNPVFTNNICTTIVYAKLTMSDHLIVSEQDALICSTDQTVMGKNTEGDPCWDF